MRVLYPIALGFALRLASVCSLAADYSGFFAPPKPTDMSVYLDLAQKVAQGELDPALAFWNPLYIYCIGALFWLTGYSPFALGLVQACVGTGSIALTYILGRQLFSARVGLLAAYGVALCKPLIAYEAFALIETLQVALVLVFCLMGLTLYRRGLLFAFFTGSIFGLLVAARSNVLLFLPVLWGSCAFRSSWLGLRAKAIARVLFFSAGLLLALLPFAVANSAATQRFSPFASNSGETIYLGNRAGASGIQEFPDVFWAMQRHARTLTYADAQSYWLDETLRSYKGVFASIPMLLAKKIAFITGGWNIANNISLELLARHDVILALPLLEYGYFAPFVCVGLFCLPVSFRTRRGRPLVLAFVATYAVSLVPLMIHGRFRLAVFPLLLVFAASTVHALWRIRSCRSAVLRMLLVLAAFALAINVALGPYGLLSQPLFGFPVWIRE